MPKAHKNVALWKYYKCKDLGPWPAEDSSHTTFKGIADWLHSIIITGKNAKIHKILNKTKKRSIIQLNCNVFHKTKKV